VPSEARRRCQRIQLWRAHLPTMAPVKPATAHDQVLGRHRAWVGGWMTLPSRRATLRNKRYAMLGGSRPPHYSSVTLMRMGLFGVPRSRRLLQRGASAPNLGGLCCLLQQRTAAPVPRQRFAESSTSPTARRDVRKANPRRASPRIRSDVVFGRDNHGRRRQPISISRKPYAPRPRPTSPRPQRTCPGRPWRTCRR
jgi:hypothetical protein